MLANIMDLDKHGTPIFTPDEIYAAIYSGHVHKCTKLLCSNSNEIVRFNHAAKLFGLPELTLHAEPTDSTEAHDAKLQSSLFMPDSYAQIDVESVLLEKCNTQCEKDRVTSELNEFEKRGMTKILQYMIFLVDTMKEHDILWGVGRGSSVASFVLYLIGIHRINSIQYGLDFNEFMR